MQLANSFDPHTLQSDNHKNTSHKGANNMKNTLSKTQLRQAVKAINAQLSTANGLTLGARQRLILTRETAYTAIKQMQAGTDYTQLKPMLDAAGLFAEYRSHKRRGTWDAARFESIGKQYGKVRVMHNVTDSAIGTLSKKVKTRKGGFKLVPAGASKDLNRHRDTYRMRDIRNADHTLRGTVRERLETQVPIPQVKTQAQDVDCAIASATTLLENAIAANDGSKVGKARETRAKNRLATALTVKRYGMDAVKAVKALGGNKVQFGVAVKASK